MSASSIQTTANARYRKTLDRNDIPHASHCRTPTDEKRRNAPRNWPMISAFNCAVVTAWGRLLAGSRAGRNDHRTGPSAGRFKWRTRRVALCVRQAGAGIATPPRRARELPPLTTSRDSVNDSSGIRARGSGPEHPKRWSPNSAIPALPLPRISRSWDRSVP